MRLVFCKKYEQELEGLEYAPMPGEYGQRVLNNISKKAWDDWVLRQTKLINENRLNLINAEDRSFLKKASEEFLFSSESGEPALCHEVENEAK